jgi:hypothetical protein
MAKMFMHAMNMQGGVVVTAKMFMHAMNMQGHVIVTAKMLMHSMNMQGGVVVTAFWGNQHAECVIPITCSAVSRLLCTVRL